MTEYASGGRIGPPRAADDDTVEALLGGGCFWLTADAVKRYGREFLESLNRPGASLSAQLTDMLELDAYLDDQAITNDQPE